MIRGVANDLRLAVRSLRGATAISLAAAVTLALGNGAAIAVFSVANGLILRPLPVAEPRSLVTVTSGFALRFGFQGGAGWNYVMWDQLQQRAAVFDGAFAWTLQRAEGAESGETRPVNALVTSGGFFDVLGVRALTGRTFSAADDVRGGGPDGGVLVIGEDFWRRRFSGVSSIVGSRLTVDGTPLTIVGVIPKSFRGVDVGQPFDVVMPFSAEALVHGHRSLRDSQRALVLSVMLRLKPGQSFAAASAAMRAMQPQIVGPGAPPFLKDPFVVVPAATGISDRSQLRQRYERPLVVLAAVSGLLLGIICVNIATLLLARATARRYELSVRLAVGASRWRLVRQVLVEGLVLAIGGTAVGILCASWGSRALVSQLPTPSGPASIGVPTDWRVLVFGTCVSLIAIALFSAGPAIYTSRVSPLEALQEQGRASRGDRRGLLSLGFIVLQVALSIVLLAGAGLFIQTFNRLLEVPLGFDPKGVLVVTVNTTRLPSPSSSRAQLYERMRDALDAVPGVSRVAGSMWTPVGGGGGGVLTDARGRRAELRPGRSAFNVVTPGWFDSYHTSLHSGRDFDARDTANGARVAIVNETYRRILLSNRAGLGEAIDAEPCGQSGCSVVGVVADTVYGSSLRDAPPPMVYVPLAQATGLRSDMPLRLSIHTEADRKSVVHAVSAALNRVDPRLTFTFRPLIDDVDAAVSQERLVARLAGLFGVVALLLSAVGLYGVVAHTAARRRGEIAVRLALGARTSDVMKLTLRQVGVAMLSGTVLGLLAALWLSRFVAPLLFGLEPHNPATLAAATALLASVAAVAAWRPMSQVMRIDPAQVLRET